MEVSEVLAKLKRFEQLLDRKNAPSASADSLPTASMDEFKATKSLLSQFSTALQGEATKLALVIGSGTSDPAATRSIHKAFVQPLEGLVTIASVISTTDFGLCERYRSFVLTTIRAVTDAAKEMIETCCLYEEKSSEEARAALHPQLLRLTGVLNAKCKQTRLLPASNSSAVIRHLLQTAVVCKDMVKEFKVLLDNIEGNSGTGSSMPEGRSGAEVEIGSDEWYAIMDGFAEDDTCSEEEAAVVTAQVEMIDAVYALLRCVSNMVKLTEDSADKVEQQNYRAWLDETVRLNNTLTQSLTDLGALLHPPHDDSLGQKAASTKQSALALATHIHKHTVDDSRKQHVCFKRFDEFVANLK